MDHLHTDPQTGSAILNQLSKKMACSDIAHIPGVEFWIFQPAEMLLFILMYIYNAYNLESLLRHYVKLSRYYNYNFIGKTEIIAQQNNFISNTILAYVSI